MPLFAEAFLVALIEPEHVCEKWRYDEDLGMNVLADGRPFVETGSGGATETLTEVRAEQDDFDRPDDDRAVGVDTTTKVRHESDDFSATLLGTETRQLPGERDDFSQEERLLGSETAIGGEADYFARGACGLIEPGGWSDTKTSVRGEADDFAAED